MDTRRLAAFIKMVELGTLTRAAEHLGIAQPSLSQQVMDLEAHFKVKLLTRTKRGVTPTPAGELLYRHAHIMIRQLEQATLELRQANVEISGTVTLGLSGSIAPVVSVPLLRKVRERYPYLTLRVVEGSYALMSELTVNGRLDIALSTGEPIKGIKSELLLTDELVLVSSPLLDAGFPSEVVPLPQLAGHPLVLPMPQGVHRTLVYDGFSSHGLAPKVVGELESTYDLVRAAREGLGSTIIGWSAALQLAPDLHIRRISDPRLSRSIYLSEPEILPSTASLAALKALLRELARELVERNQWAGGVLASEEPTKP